MNTKIRELKKPLAKQSREILLNSKDYSKIKNYLNQILIYIRKVKYLIKVCHYRIFLYNKFIKGVIFLKFISQGHKLHCRHQFQNRRKSNVSRTLIKY